MIGTKRTIALATTGLLCLGVTFGPSGVASAAPTSSLQTHAVDSATNRGQGGVEVDSADLTKAFTLIESIPDDVLLQGDAAAAAWFDDHERSPDARASILGCSGAIALVIASTAFPVAKILKIKRLINSMGGVATAVRTFWGASFSYEKIRALGGAAAALGAQLLGITQIRQQCFS